MRFAFLVKTLGLGSTIYLRKVQMFSNFVFSLII